MNVLTDPISIWHLLLVVGVVWLYFWNEQRKLKQEIKEHAERVEELYRENAELREKELNTALVLPSIIFLHFLFLRKIHRQKNT